MKYILNIAEPLAHGGVLPVIVHADSLKEAYDAYFDQELYVLGKLISVDAVPLKPTLIERIVNLFKR